MPLNTSVAGGTVAPDPGPGAGATLLRITDRSNYVSHVALNNSPNVIGRGDDVDIPLESGSVSRQHAELSRDPFGRWWVRDLGSRNGTRVNGTTVSEALLRPGDVLQVGDFRLALSPPAPRLAESTATVSSPILTQSGEGDRITRFREHVAPKIDATHLQAVTEFGHQLNVTQDEGERLRRLCHLMLGPQFRGETAAVLRIMRDSSAGPQVRCGPVVAPHCREAMPPVSRSVLRALYESPEPVLATNYAAGGPNPASPIELSTSPDVMPMSVIAIPLHFDQRVIDVLYVVFSPEYGHADWLALASLAVKQYQQAESVWLHVGTIREYAAIERELERAQDIQQRLIPRDLRIKGMDLAIGFKPCNWVGGDYADVLPMADGRVLMTVADVCGKGLSAALVASTLHTMVHAGVRAGKALEPLVSELNQYLIEDLGGESLVTLIGVAIDPSTGEFECVNCGHPPGLILSSDGSVREFQSASNPLLGIEVAPLKMQTGVVGRSDLFAIFTDGLTELLDQDDEMLGIEKLEKGLNELNLAAPGAPASVVADGLTRFLDAFQGRRTASDDRTFLLGRLS
jgi:hypothetical protein